MLVGFNPYSIGTNNKNNFKSTPSKAQNFTSLKDGKIIAEEVAKETNAMLSINFIKNGGYKPTLENLNELNNAKKIASKDVHSALSVIDYLDEAIEVLKQKAKDVGINL